MKTLLALAAAVALAACGHISPPKVAVNAPGTVELPFRSALDGLVLITGRVNGVHDVEFILDTGAPVSVLMDGELNRPLGLDTRGARKLGPEDEPAAPVGVIKGGFRVDFGPIAMTDLTAVVIPVASLPCPERFTAVSFGGVVGADLFRRFVVEIDWKAGRVRFHPPEGWKAPADARIVPLEFVSGHPYASAKVRSADGKEIPARMHVDTGMTTALRLPVGTGSPFAMPAEGKVRRACFAAGVMEAREGAAVSLAVGDASLDAVTPVYFASAKALSLSTGSIGAGALSRTRLFIDYPRERLLLAPPG